MSTTLKNMKNTKQSLERLFKFEPENELLLVDLEHTVKACRKHLSIEQGMIEPLAPPSINEEQIVRLAIQVNRFKYHITQTKNIKDTLVLLKDLHKQQTEFTYYHQWSAAHTPMVKFNEQREQNIKMLADILSRVTDLLVLEASYIHIDQEQEHEQNDAGLLQFWDDLYPDFRDKYIQLFINTPIDYVTIDELEKQGRITITTTTTTTTTTNSKYVVFNSQISSFKLDEKNKTWHTELPLLSTLNDAMQWLIRNAATRVAIRTDDA
jgi:hypothetical protein